MITINGYSDTADAKYVSLVPDGDLIETYCRQRDSLRNLFSPLSESQAEYRYSMGKWSVKEVLGHIIDTERVCTFRLLCAARGDTTRMASFNEDDYVIEGNFHKRPIFELVEEWSTVRQASISLLDSLSGATLQNHGCFKNRRTDAFTIACIMAGHVSHHIGVLQERYNISTVERNET